MASFYQDMTEEQINEHHTKFYDNFKQTFGFEPTVGLVFPYLEKLYQEKVEEFVRQNYGDFSPSVTRRMVSSIPNMLMKRATEIAEKIDEATKQADELAAWAHLMESSENQIKEQIQGNEAPVIEQPVKPKKKGKKKD